MTFPDTSSLGNCSPPDVKETLDEAVRNKGINHIQVKHRLNDNGFCYLSGQLKSYLEKQRMVHTLGASYHFMIEWKL